VEKKLEIRREIPSLYLIAQRIKDALYVLAYNVSLRTMESIKNNAEKEREKTQEALWETHGQRMDTEIKKIQSENDENEKKVVK
jgi:hypothetical protein